MSLARSPIRRSYRPTGPTSLDRRPTTQPGRDARAESARERLDAIVAAAEARAWVGCGDLCTNADRRSPFFQRLPDAQRFALSYVIAPSGCWEWVGSRKAAGYGQFRFRRTGWYSHRVAYTMFVGEIPDGLTLDHLCLNKPCVNPAHLEPVTQAENTRRYGRTITHCPQGHEYTPANTMTKGTRRQCRACHNKRAIASAKARGGRPVAARTVAVLNERSGGLCEMGLPVCTGVATDPAHRIGRKAGGRPNDDLDYPANLIYACRCCHRWTHEHPADARDRGLMLLEGQNPATEPVLIVGGRFVYLTNSATYADEPPSPLAPVGADEAVG